MLGDPGSAHDRMALPFRDIEDAVGTFATVGGLRYAIGLFAGASGAGQAEALRAIVALTAVFAAAAEAVVVSLGACRFRPGNATLAGLRVLAIDIVSRLHAAQPATETRTQRLAGILVDTDATLSIARGPRLARQAHLGAAALRGAKSMA